MRSEPRHGTRTAEVIEVIRTTATRGNGETSIFREVVSYWTKDGTLLAEVDPFPALDGEQHDQPDA